MEGQSYRPVKNVHRSPIVFAFGLNGFVYCQTSCQINCIIFFCLGLNLLQ